MPWFVIIKDSNGDILWKSKALYAGFEVFYEVWNTIVEYHQEGVRFIYFDHPYLPLRAVFTKNGEIFEIDVIYEESAGDDEDTDSSALENGG